MKKILRIKYKDGKLWFTNHNKIKSILQSQLECIIEYSFNQKIKQEMSLNMVGEKFLIGKTIYLFN